jgi:hypothetical protein
VAESSEAGNDERDEASTSDVNQGLVFPDLPSRRASHGGVGVRHTSGPESLILSADVVEGTDVGDRDIYHLQLASDLGDDIWSELHRLAVWHGHGTCRCDLADRVGKRIRKRLYDLVMSLRVDRSDGVAGEGVVLTRLVEVRVGCDPAPADLTVTGGESLWKVVVSEALLDVEDPL